MNDMEKAPLIKKGDGFKPFGLFWNIVKSFAGAGTFAMPYAVMNAGLWTGVIGVAVIAVFSTYTIHILLKCGERVMENNSHKTAKNMDVDVAPPSYPEIGRAALGNIGAYIVSVYSSLMCFGVCIAYFTLIGGNLETLFRCHLTTTQIIWIVFPVCLILCALTDLRALAYTSIGGSVALVVAMISVIAYGFQNHLLVSIGEYPALEWRTFPLFMGTAAFLFCSHVVVLPLANSCGNFRKFPRILDFAVIFVAILNIAFAGLAYGFWRGETKGNVIDNLPAGSIIGDIVRAGISAEVLASFPLVASAGFQSLETAFVSLNRVKAFPLIPPGHPHPFISRNPFYYLFRWTIIALLALLASTISSFGDFVSLVGSLTIMATGFIFPQLFYLRLYAHDITMTNRIIQIAIMVFGVGMTILGTVQATQALIKALSETAEVGPCSK